MVCQKWNGTGVVENERYYRYSNVIAYERGISPQAKCKQCNGSGYIIGNINDALHDLTYLVNTEINAERKRILQQVINLIKK